MVFYKTDRWKISGNILTIYENTSSNSFSLGSVTCNEVREGVDSLKHPFEIKSMLSTL